MALPLEECGWRQVGSRLHDAWRLAFDDLNTNQATDQEVYYTMLSTIVRRCQADMDRIKPDSPDDDSDSQPVLSNPDDTPPQESSTVVVIEKIADMTHKGSGL